MRRRSTLLLISVMIFCFICPGCKYIVKKKLRKLKESVTQVNQAKQIEVIGFWADGCAPCRRAKAILTEAGIQVAWIKADCYNQEMVRKYKIRMVPTFIMETDDETVRTHDPIVVIATLRIIKELAQGICDGKEGCCP